MVQKLDMERLKAIAAPNGGGAAATGAAHRTMGQAALGSA
jgi:hypothetical protein